MADTEKSKEQLPGDLDALREALRKAQGEIHYLKSILDAFGDGVSVQDSSFRILYQNQVHRELLGDHVGEVCHSAYHGKDEICEGCQLDDVLKREGISKKERMVPTTRGNTYIEVTEAPLRDATGRMIGGVGIVRDITERKKMQEELLKKQKLESIGVLAGGIAHDFNNLLTAVLGNISLVKLDLDEGSRPFEQLTDAEHATLRAKDLTQQLLTFSMGGEPTKRPILLNTLLEESIPFALSGSNVRFNLTVAPDLWPVDADEWQIGQVFHNVIMNANEAMPDGGTIEVRAENVCVPENATLPVKEGRYVRIGIEDHGRGIPENDLPRIFDPYFTSRELGSEKGRGLGLAIAYTVVKEHQGYIDVASKVGSGTTFSIYFPASHGEVRPASGAEQAIAAGSGRVLVMDDEEMICSVAKDILNYLGYDVLCADNGKEAISLYVAEREASRPFHAVIMDVTIPGGMGGREAIRELLAIDPQAKVIVSSGYSNNPLMSNYRNYGFRAAIRKPYSVQEMSRALSAIRELGTETDA